MRKEPRYEVLSVRMNPERLALMKRYRHVLADQLGRAVSLGEATFLVLEARAFGVDRAASRHEMLQTPTTSLDGIRKRWASYQTLSPAEWDVLAEYVHIGTDAGRQTSPRLQPVVPSRESYLALLDAFEAVYENRKESASPHAWEYFGQLEGYATPVRLSDHDADQRHQAVLNQIADRRDLLRGAAPWEPPGNIGWCIRTAIHEEAVDSTRLDRILAPHWPTLWGLAARGHWIRHDGQPVRAAGAAEHDGRCQYISLPSAISVGHLTASFSPSGGTDFAMEIDFESPRRCSYRIGRYPELIEFRAMLEGVSDQPWHGRCFFCVASKDQERTTRTLWLKRQDVRVEFSECEWNELRDLFRQAWQSPDLQRRMHELEQEYGEQG